MVVERLMEVTMRLLTLIVLLTMFAAKQTNALLAILLGAIMIVATLAVIAWLLKNREAVVARLVSWGSRLPYLSVDQIESNLDELMEGLDEASSRGRMAISLLISVVMWWVFFLAFHYLILSSIPTLFVSWQDTMAMALAVLVIVPPSTLPMPGVYHGMVIAVLVATRLAGSSEATAYSIVLHLPQMILWIGFGIWSLLRTDLKLGDLLHGARQLADQKPSEQPGHGAS
jgi:hypothetical protein